jgi:septal ring factor EnvC (AmiA/AmiB activator)
VNPTPPVIPDNVVTSAITTLIGGIILWIGRIIFFRLTLSGKLAVGADEELKVLRNDMKNEIRQLRSEIDSLRNDNAALREERAKNAMQILTQGAEIKELQEERLAQGIEIEQLREDNRLQALEIKDLKRRISKEENAN